MSSYQPIHIDNLAAIQKQALLQIPLARLHQTGLFYLENNTQDCLGIPELQEALTDLQLRHHVSGIAVYVLCPGTEPSIHKDSGHIQYSINIPLSGCDNTFVNFYQSHEPPQSRVSPSGHRYWHWPIEACELVDQLEMTTPHIINVKNIHAVVNSNTQTRITLLIRLQKSVGVLF